MPEILYFLSHSKNLIRFKIRPRTKHFWLSRYDPVAFANIAYFYSFLSENLDKESFFSGCYHEWTCRRTGVKEEAGYRLFRSSERTLFVVLAEQDREQRADRAGRGEHPATLP